MTVPNDPGDIERWADDHFTQGEVAVVMRLVEEFGWRPPSQNAQETAEDDAAPSSYHDLHVTTASLARTSIFNLPYGYEVSCNRVSGWCVWLNGKQVAGEYSDGLRLDVAGHVICDSLTRPVEEPS